jgi:glycosyltransferase involved in cell wall biosynthesis
MNSANTADISVVIPTFNRTNLLLEAVQSVLNQTRKAREILVIDNGTEKMAASALMHASQNIRIICVPPNGTQYARNIGILSATSTWIAFLDDDDILAPDYIEQVEKAMLVGPSDIIGTDHRKFSRDGAENSTNLDACPPGYWDGMSFVRDGALTYFNGAFPLERLLLRIPFYCSMTVIKRKLAVDIGGFNGQMKGILSEDLEFIVRALTHGRLTLVFKPLVLYRIHAGNATSDSVGRIFGRWQIFEFVRSFHKGLPQCFVDALEQDLIDRRVRIFDLGCQTGRYDVAQRVAPLLRRHDWTFTRRLFQIAGRLPRPIERTARWLRLYSRRYIGHERRA